MQQNFVRALKAVCSLALCLLASCAHQPSSAKPGEGLPGADTGNEFSRTLAAGAASGQSAGETLLQQSYTHYLRGDFSRAITQLEASLLLEKGASPWAKYLLYYCYMATGDYPRALALAEEIVKAHPLQSLAYQQVGLAQLWLGQSAAAVEALARALEFEAHAPRIHFYLSLAYSALNRPEARDRSVEEGVREYEQILRSNPKDFGANYELASLYLYWNQKLDQVPKLLTAAQEGIPQSAEEDLPPEKKLFSQYYLPVLEGIYYHRKGELKESVARLVSALGSVPAGVRPDIAEIYFYVAKNHLALGEKALAKSFLEKGLSIDPKGPYAGESLKTIHAIASRGSTSP